MCPSSQQKYLQTHPLTLSKNKIQRNGARGHFQQRAQTWTHVIHGSARGGRQRLPLVKTRRRHAPLCMCIMLLADGRRAFGRWKAPVEGVLLCFALGRANGGRPRVLPTALFHIDALPSSNREGKAGGARKRAKSRLKKRSCGSHVYRRAQRRGQD